MKTLSTNNLTKLTLGTLGLEFVLGMLANLYQEVPEHDPGQVFHQFGYIMVHSIVAMLLLALGIWLIVRLRGTKQFGLAIGGLSAVLIATIFGHVFVATGNDIFSLGMALAFLGAFGSYLRLKNTNL